MWKIGLARFRACGFQTSVPTRSCRAGLAIGGAGYFRVTYSRKKAFSTRGGSLTLHDSRRPSGPGDFGQIPKWPTGEDCKSSGFAFTGSNPVLPILLLTCFFRGSYRSKMSLVGFFLHYIVFYCTAQNLGTFWVLCCSLIIRPPLSGTLDGGKASETATSRTGLKTRT